MLPPLFGRSLCAVVLGGTLGVSLADPAPLMPVAEVSAADAAKAVVVDVRSPWFFTAGTTVRSIDAGFHLNGGKLPSPDWSSRYRRARGDVGFYTGGAPVQYDDGLVGPDWGIETGVPASGDAQGTIMSASQLVDSGRIDSYNLRPIYDLSFHSNSYHYPRTVNPGTADVSDSDLGVGPSLQLGYQLRNEGGLLINLVTGWSYLSSEQNSGAQTIAAITETELFVRHTYTYDFLDFDFFLPGPTTGGDFPYVLQQGGIVYDADTANISPPPPGYFGSARDPRQQDAVVRESTIRYYAIGSADLDVHLNEIPFGVEIGGNAGPVQIFLTGGATLNVIDYSLESQVSWFQAGSARALATERWREADTDLKVGLYGGITARYPLTRDGKLFLEAHGSYRWVDPVHNGAGFAEVEIDPSSWEGGIGIGLVFP